MKLLQMQDSTYRADDVVALVPEGDRLTLYLREDAEFEHKFETAGEAEAARRKFVEEWAVA